MSSERAGEAYAYLCVFAREANDRGDAVVDALPFVADTFRRRGGVFESDRTIEHTAATLSTDGVPLDDLPDAIEKLIGRLRPHTTALRALRGRARLWLAVVPAGIVGSWRIRFTPETIAWLAQIDARLWIDASLDAPEGTENGPVCGYCKVDRPAPGDEDEAIVDMLSGYGPYHGIADARLVGVGLDHDEHCTITQTWKYLYAQIGELDAFVLAGKPWATSEKRDGGAPVAILLARLRKNRPVWRALRRGNPSAIEIRVRHWANMCRPGLWLTRRDLRRLAKLGAMFLYQLIPDPKPSFGEDGRCNHCSYVQAWSAPAGEETSGGAVSGR